MTIFRQKTTVPDYGTVLTSTCVEHYLHRRSHLLNVLLESVPNLLVGLDVEEYPGGLISQHSSLFRTDCRIRQEPVSSGEDGPLVAVLLSGPDSPSAVGLGIEALLGDNEDISPDLFIFELVYQMRLLPQKSISADIRDNVPNNGRHAGNVVLINESQNIFEGVLVVALGVVPAHRIHPDRGAVVLDVADEVTMSGDALRPAPAPGHHSRVLCHRGALACPGGAHADNAAILPTITVSGSRY